MAWRAVGVLDGLGARMQAAVQRGGVQHERHLGRLPHLVVLVPHLRLHPHAHLREKPRCVGPCGPPSPPATDAHRLSILFALLLEPLGDELRRQAR